MDPTIDNSNIFRIKNDDDDDDYDEDEEVQQNFDAMLKNHNDTMESSDEDEDDDFLNNTNDHDDFMFEQKDGRYANNEGDGQDFKPNWSPDNFHMKLTSTPHHTDLTPPTFQTSFPTTAFSQCQYGRNEEPAFNMLNSNNNDARLHQQFFETEDVENQYGSRTDDYDSIINNDPTAFVRDKCQYPSTYNNNFDNTTGTMLSDKNEQFFGKVGSRGEGQMEQMKILHDEVNAKYIKSEEELANLREDLMSKERIIKHVEKQLEDSRHIYEHEAKQNRDLNFEIQNLLKEKERFRMIEERMHAEVSRNEMIIESLEKDIANLRSADMLSNMKQQHESVLFQLEERHRNEMSQLKENFGLSRARIVEQEEMIKNLKEERDRCTKEFHSRELDMDNTITKLTQSLHDSQQSRMMLMKNNYGNASDTNALLSHLEELQFNLKKVEDLNKALEEENVGLNGQLALQQSRLNRTNGIAPTNRMREQIDDSYAQLNIKIPNGLLEVDRLFTSGDNLKNLPNPKLAPADNLSAMINHMKNQNEALNDQLKKINDEKKTMEAELRNVKSLLKEKSEIKVQQLPCNGNCVTASTFNNELQNLHANNKSLASIKIKLQSELAKKEDLIKQQEVEIKDFNVILDALEEKHNIERRIALEKCEDDWKGKLDKVLEASLLDANYELETLRRDHLDMEIKLSRVQQEYLECCERIQSLEKDSNAEWQKKINEMEDRHKTEILRLKEFYGLQQNKINRFTNDSKSVQVELDDELSKKVLFELNERLEKMHASLLSLEAMKHQLEKTLQDRNEAIDSMEKVIQSNKKEIEKLTDNCIKLEQDVKDTEAKVRQNIEEEANRFITDCMGKMNITHESGFNEKWPLSQKVKYLIKSQHELFSKQNETLAKESVSIEREADLERKIALLEKESLAYVGLNMELRDKNIQLIERLSEVNSEVESLRDRSTKNESVRQNYEKTKKKLEEYRLENKNLHSVAKKSEEKIERLQGEVEQAKTRVDTACSENGDKLKDELIDAVNKLMESRRTIINLETEAKRRLNEMMQSMEREKEVAISLLKKDFQREVKVLEMEKKISNQQYQKEMKQLKLQLEEIIAEKKALESSDLSERLLTYKENVEDARRYYNKRVNELDRKEKEYEKARCKMMEVIRKSYLHALVDYLKIRFDNCTAIEIMANIEVQLDSISPRQIDGDILGHSNQKNLHKPSHPLASEQKNPSQGTSRSVSQLSSHQTVSQPSSRRLNYHDTT